MKTGYANRKREELFEKLKANGHKIYSIELDEINKASERFHGLSDAVKTADRATKTPHVDDSIIADNAVKSSAGADK